MSGSDLRRNVHNTAFLFQCHLHKLVVGIHCEDRFVVAVMSLAPHHLFVFILAHVFERRRV